VSVHQDMAIGLGDRPRSLAVRSFHLEMVAGWKLLHVFHLSSLLRGLNRAAGCQGALAHESATEVKLFLWFALHNRLWTADRCKRHGLQDDDGCALCCQEPETGIHLFSGCVVTKEIWLHALHVLQSCRPPPHLGGFGCW